MADSNTTNYSLVKPEVGASEDTWGTKLNQNLDTIDSKLDDIEGKSGAATLKHTNSTKLQTTATGVDVTGAITADGLTVDDTTGTVVVDAGQFVVRNPARNANLLWTAIGGDSKYTAILGHEDGTKLATTSTGVDVTGAITADGLTIDGDATISKTGGTTFILENSTSSPYSGTELQGSIVFKNHDTSGDGDHIGARIDSYVVDTVGSANLQFQTGRSDANLAKRMEINEDGDVSFYEDTGTTAKFVWDSSAESLELGTSSGYTPVSTLAINETTNTPAIEIIPTVDDSNANTASIRLWGTIFGTANRHSEIRNVTDGSTANNELAFDTNGTERLRIDSSGNVGIGTASPSARLDVVTPSGFSAVKTHNGTSTLNFGVSSDNTTFIENTTAQPIRFLTNYSERARIDSSGNLLVGTTNTNLYNNATDDYGVKLADGNIQVSGSSTLGYFNRQNSDGDIVQFRKDGSTVGSIGVDNSDNLYITGNSSHAGLMCGSTEILPYKGTTLNDGVNDIGASSFRWKDLYLSGHIYGSDNATKIFGEKTIYTTTNGSLSTTATDFYLNSQGDLTTGTYLLSVYVSGGGVWYTETWAGIMQWFSSNTNSSSSTDIYMTGMGHSSLGKVINARVLRKSGNTGLHSIQLWSNVATSGHQITIKAKRLR